jgi:hypothetical protein
MKGEGLEERVAGLGVRLKGSLTLEIDENLENLNLEALHSLFKPCSDRLSDFERVSGRRMEGRVESPHYIQPPEPPQSAGLISLGEPMSEYPWRINSRSN